MREITCSRGDEGKTVTFRARGGYAPARRRGAVQDGSAAIAGSADVLIAGSAYALSERGSPLVALLTKRGANAEPGAGAAHI